VGVQCPQAGGDAPLQGFGAITFHGHAGARENPRDEFAGLIGRALGGQESRLRRPCAGMARGSRSGRPAGEFYVPQVIALAPWRVLRVMLRVCAAAGFAHDLAIPNVPGWAPQFPVRTLRNITKK
jgi:hypothetical protein